MGGLGEYSNSRIQSLGAGAGDYSRDKQAWPINSLELESDFWNVYTCTYLSMYHPLAQMFKPGPMAIWAHGVAMRRCIQVIYD